MSNPNTPGLPSRVLACFRAATPARKSRWFRVLAACAFAGYVVFLATKTTAVAGGSDSSGYLNSARLLAAGRLQAELRFPPEMGPAEEVDRNNFTPLGFAPSTIPTQITPSYPTGLPLHFAVAAKLFGWHAGPLLVELLAAAGALGLCYLVARELGLSPALAAAGAATLAAFPVFLFTSIQALSDTLATTWCLAALYGGLRGRNSRPWAAAAGAAFSFAVLVRPTNVLLAPALLVLLGLDARRLAAFVVAGLPGAAWFAFYNHHQYGGALASGYGDVASAFSLVWGLPTLRHFATWLALLLPAALLVLPFFALGQRATRGRELAALVLGFGAITGLYLFYDVSHDVWWCLRFILPVVPALILAGLLGVEALALGPGARWPRAFRPAAALVLAVWAVGVSWYWTPRLHIYMVQQYEQAYADASRLARERLPADALLVANNFSGALYFYTDSPVLRADVVEAAAFTRYAAAARAAGRPVCAVLFEFEEEDAFTNRCPGEWQRLFTFANIGFWQLK